MRPALLLLAALSPLAVMAAEPSARWWKGNLHTHSHWSDGDDYPEMIANWYKQRGYNFLALSDHNILSDHERWISIAKSKGGQPAFDKYLAQFGADWVEQRTAAGDKEVRLKTLGEFRPKFEEPGKFLMIQSEEVTGRFLTAPIHINVTNIRECLMPTKGKSVTETIQKTFDAVGEQRRRTGVPMFAHVNHPNFGWALTAEEMLHLEGERFFEVYNGHPQVHNEGDAKRAGTERIWDILLTERLAELHKPAFLGLATDDSHNYHQEPDKLSRPGRGWIMVRAARLTADDLVAGIEAGDFYASSGVTLREVQTHGDTLSVEIDAQPGVSYTTEFIGTRKGYDRASTPVTADDGATMRTTRQYSADIGKVLATAQGPSASYRVKGDEIYVRARITSSKLKEDPYREGEVEMAWTQPLVVARN
jgi:hypothetical protein